MDCNFCGEPLDAIGDCLNTECPMSEDNDAFFDQDKDEEDD